MPQKLVSAALINMLDADEAWHNAVIEKFPANWKHKRWDIEFATLERAAQAARETYTEILRAWRDKHC